MDRPTQEAIRSLALATAPRPRLVILTGAGISAESGLSTYRGPDGLYSDGSKANLVTAETFGQDRDAVITHLACWRDQALKVSPNRAHRALVELEAALGKAMTVITQNVDNLHQRAGSRRVLAIHGDLTGLRCEARRPHIQPWEGELQSEALCHHLIFGGLRRCSARLRPNVVLFGEPILFGKQVERAVTDCTAFWAIGTSGTVAPAATLVLAARLSGAETALFNLTPPGEESGDDSIVTAAYHHVILGPATETVPVAVNELLGACH